MDLLSGNRKPNQRGLGGSVLDGHAAEVGGSS
jgi:hypothetical protein